jgi:hypothetical protein
MATPSARPLRLYAIGLGCVFAGAWATSVTGSMLPLAMSSSAALVYTFLVVQRGLARSKSKH